MHIIFMNIIHYHTVQYVLIHLHNFNCKTLEVTNVNKQNLVPQLINATKDCQVPNCFVRMNLILKNDSIKFHAHRQAYSYICKSCKQKTQTLPTLMSLKMI